MTAAELIAEYKGNEIKADNIYKGKVVNITGVVGDISKDFTNSGYLKIGSGAAYEHPQIQCMLKKDQLEQASNLNKGDSIRVSGTVSGLTFNVIVRNCVIL